MSVGPAITDKLERLLTLAGRAEASGIATDAQALLERTREGRFFVACIGQFKRGKSTLINALLDDEVLPSGVPPVTSVVTVVRYGERRARVRIGADEWHDIRIDQIPDFVSESANPENGKGVTGVEVYCPSPCLQRGLCLVDTPGIGSVFAGNTAETRAFVPHIDAALVVLGGDPPISGEELDLLDTVARQVRTLLIVLNKVDRLSEDERREARAFTEKVITQRVPGAADEMLEVSALERLRGTGSARHWNALVARIQELACSGASEIVEAAAARGLANLSARLRRHLDEERHALFSPVAESERRLAELRRCAADAEQSLVELRHLFDGEQAKLAKRFEDERKKFVAGAMPEVTRELDDRLSGAPVRRGPKLRRFAREQAQSIAERVVGVWLVEQAALADREFAAVTDRFVELANASLGKLQESGEVPADALPAALAAETGLHAPSRYYFLSHMEPGSPWSGPLLLDLIRGERSARAAAAAAGRELAEWLLRLNANRVESDVADRIFESRRSVEGSVRGALQEISTTAAQAIGRAQTVRARGEQAVAAAVAEVERGLSELRELEDAAPTMLARSSQRERCLPASNQNAGGR